MRAFLSHASADKTLVLAVHNALEPMTTWLDRAEIEWGDVFLEKILAGEGAGAMGQVPVAASQLRIWCQLRTLKQHSQYTIDTKDSGARGP